MFLSIILLRMFFRIRTVGLNQLSVPCCFKAQFAESCVFQRRSPLYGPCRVPAACVGVDCCAARNVFRLVHTARVVALAGRSFA
jgi:hypothetical protein